MSLLYFLLIIPIIGIFLISTIHSLIYGIIEPLAEYSNSYVSNSIVPKGTRNYSTLSVRDVSTKDKEDKLNPWYVTGFSDAESHFGVEVTKSKTIKLGWQVKPKFAIKLHKKDINIIQEISNFFFGW